MTKSIQAKHVPDAAVLAIVDGIREREDRWTHTWDLEPAFPGVPPKVLRAKMASLIRRGILEGCTCGCRGDFQRPTPPPVLPSGATIEIDRTSGQPGDTLTGTITVKPRASDALVSAVFDAAVKRALDAAVKP